MPIMSYIAYPANGKKDQLKHALFAIPECEVIPATNQDILVVVTDTKDKQAEQALQAILKSIPSLECLALVSGYDEHSLNTSM